MLWALSTCANEWQSAEKLTRLCTIPEPVLSGAWDKTRYAMEARIRADAYMKIRQWNVPYIASGWWKCVADECRSVPRNLSRIPVRFGSRAKSNGRTFVPPAIRGFDGSKCSRSSRFWTRRAQQQKRPSDF